MQGNKNPATAGLNGFYHFFEKLQQFVSRLFLASPVRLSLPTVMVFKLQWFSV